MISLLLVTLSCGVAFGLPGYGKSNEEWERFFSSQECVPTNNLTIPKSFFNPTVEDIEFRLYTSTSPLAYKRLVNNDASSITGSTLNASWPMVVIAHGFQGGADECMWMHHIKDKWLEKGPANVILVQWNLLADKNIFCYPQAAKNARFVGTQLGNLLKFLKDNTGLSPTSTHIIGFSLGAHVAGVAGYQVINLTNNTKLARITGLDPAYPLFNGIETKDRLDREDADFIDILHTNAGILGYLETLGHVDFYMNGGTFQNGCPSIGNGLFKSVSCHHSRGHEYYIESLDALEPSYGFMCEDYATFKKGYCLQDYENNSIGYAVTPEVEGLFYSSTQAEPSFLTRSISIRLVAGETDNDSSYQGQVYVHVNLPSGRIEEIVEMTSDWNEKIKPGKELKKLATIPSGTLLNSTQVSVMFYQIPLFPQVAPHYLIAKPIEAYDAFEKQVYCVSGCIDIEHGETKTFTPTKGRCPVIDCGHSSTERFKLNKPLLVLNLYWILHLTSFF